MHVNATAVASAHERRSGRMAATAPSRGAPATRRGHRRASAGGVAGLFAGQGRSRPGPRPGLRRALSPFRLLPALALLLGALSPFAAAPAAADVLVSNMVGGNEGQIFSLSGSEPLLAQGFTTGTHADGDVDQALWLYFLDNYRANDRNLVAVKKRWDPENVFHHAQSIPVS